MTGFSHDQETLNAIKELGEVRQEALEAGMATLMAGSGALTPFDLIVIGAAKRAVSVSVGIEQAVSTRNMVCARALLRMQLDTVLRYSAFRHVDKAQEVARRVIAGEPIRKMKSRCGKPLHDSFLVEKLGEHFSWVPEVYKRTSGYVHFCESQFYDSVASFQVESGEMEIAINETDEKFPASSWIEVVNCATHCLVILRNFIRQDCEQKDIQLKK